MTLKYQKKKSKNVQRHPVFIIKITNKKKKIKDIKFLWRNITHQIKNLVCFLFSLFFK